jgi:hypothetical protein
MLTGLVTGAITKLCLVVIIITWLQLLNHHVLLLDVLVLLGEENT